MSEIQRRIVARLSRYAVGDYAQAAHLASFLGVHKGTVNYNVWRLQMRGVVQSKIGPDGGYALIRKR